MGSFSYYGPYVSVAEKTAKARRAVEQLRRKGLEVKPICAFKGALATTFWGKSWNANLEQYADYENRLGRGRSYVRNGFICHLEINKGQIKAQVSGTSLYDVTINIKTLAPERWEKLCGEVAGQIGSLMELLQGKFSKEIMAKVCDQDTGLFPKPSEITFRCSCPDWASMCKHVAAVLYAIGRRLDTEPELLFTLRGVDPAELLPSKLDLSDTPPSQVDLGDVGELFGIDLDEGPMPEQESPLKESPVPNPSKTKSNPPSLAENLSKTKDTAKNLAKIKESPKKSAKTKETTENFAKTEKSTETLAKTQKATENLAKSQKATENLAKTKKTTENLAKTNVTSKNSTRTQETMENENMAQETMENEAKTHENQENLAETKDSGPNVPSGQDQVSPEPNPNETQKQSQSSKKPPLDRDYPTGEAVKNLRDLAGLNQEA
ncbi:MAG: SWIM zinc finger family protein, partial [Desulfovibrio sp.]|nr:SWIM zinc finger family protein [Desulfovibrio sp.]